MKRRAKLVYAAKGAVLVASALLLLSPDRDDAAAPADSPGMGTTPAASGGSPIPAVVIERAVATDVLVFPPKEAPRHATLSLRGEASLTPATPTASAGPPRELAIVSPQLDEKRRVLAGGKRVRIRFSEAIRDAKAGASIGIEMVKMTPAWGKTARFIDTETIELADSKPLVPETEYAVSFSKLEGATGATMATSSLTLVGRALVGDKLLDYVPNPGVPRAVSVDTGGSSSGPLPSISVLFDQPVVLGASLPKVEIVDPSGASLPLWVGYATSGTFEGNPVDPKAVLTARPLAPLPRDAYYTVRVTDSVTTLHDSVSIPAVARVEGLACPSGDAATCAVDETTNELVGVADGVSITLSGAPKRPNTPKSLVRVTPKVDDLEVSFHSEELRLSGTFARSKKYVVDVSGLEDRFAGPLAASRYAFRTAPATASVTIPAGVIHLDDGALLPAAARNVTAIRVRLWKLGDKDVGGALAASARDEVPGRDPDVAYEVKVASARDRDMDVPIPIANLIAKDVPYVVATDSRSRVEGAPIANADDNGVEKPTVAVVLVDGPDAIWAHAHRTGDRAAVVITRRSSGEPVGGARVDIGEASAVTDVNGFALLAAKGDVLNVSAGKAREIVPMTARDEEAGEAPTDVRAFVMTDRGAYRPGSSMYVAASLREPNGNALRPISGKALDVRLVDPRGVVHERAIVTTSALGSASVQVRFRGDAPTGDYDVELHDGEAVIAHTTVLVAAYERPRSLLDVALSKERSMVRADFEGRLAFGGALAKARVAWRATWEKAELPGPWPARGFSFATRSSTELAAMKGEATLDEKGKLRVAVPARWTGGAPQKLVFVAESTDEGWDSAIGRSELVVGGAGRTVGVKIASDPIVNGLPIEPQIVVVDETGAAVGGARVRLELARVSYTLAASVRTSGGSERTWVPSRSVEATCVARSDASGAVGCAMRPKGSGDYVIRATLDGIAFAEGDAYVKPAPGAPAPRRPGSHDEVDVYADQSTYDIGSNAKIFVASPFVRSTALVTVEAGSIVTAFATQLEGAGTIEVPLQGVVGSNAHATVTLLSRERSEQVLQGQVSFKVRQAEPPLDVSVALDRTEVRPREDVEVSVAVSRDGAAATGAEVVVVVVDEAVLRLTNHAYPSPQDAFARTTSVDFDTFDSRRLYDPRAGRSHIAGDGGGEGVEPRKDFRETAFFAAGLLSDANGKVKLKVPLGDDLARYRVTAIALDASGSSGTARASLQVERPVLVEPLQPRFVVEGDQFEIAARVANRTKSALTLDVREGTDVTQLVVAAGKTEVVRLQREAKSAGDFAVAWSVTEAGGGAVLDAVQKPIPVWPKGVVERPALAAAFKGARSVDVKIPEGVFAAPEDALEVRIGAGFPELGPVLSSLLDYPHGCVEQTTSSTMPLLVARGALPKLGVDSYDPADLDKKIAAGIARLASMQTSEGGLGYWPGDSDPHPFGTAYAMRGLGYARRAGIAVPKQLALGLETYANKQLVDAATDADRVMWAEALDLFGAEVPAGIIEGLYERRAELTRDQVAALATLVTARRQTDRAEVLADRIEQSLEASPLASGSDAYDPFASPTITQAREAMALSRVRPDSRYLPDVLRSLLAIERSTTVDTAFALLALTEHLDRPAEELADVTVTLDGVALERDASADETATFKVPVGKLAGKTARLELRGPADVSLGFVMRASWVSRSAPAKASVAKRGPSVHRLYLDEAGNPLDPGAIPIGTLVRVVLAIHAPIELPQEQRQYLALTDPIPAGFEPVDPRLMAFEPSDDQPNVAIQKLVGTALSSPDHVDLRDDRVQVYVDEMDGDTVVTSYLARATTKGRFIARPTFAEWMYVPDGDGRGAGTEVVVQ
ncbi:MAG: hypothetical protein HOW73_35790 [Polyangiaceae bacterium]|nr:hypothetical protein [Polyangiaceae bacterium]